MNAHPEQQTTWTSRDGWKCAFALIAVHAILYIWLRIGAQRNPFFLEWLATPLGLVVSVGVQGGAFLFLTLLFSRVDSVQEFVTRAGLQRGVTMTGWCAAWVAIAIALINSYGTAKGWTASSRRPHPAGYDLLGWGWWIFTLKTVAFVPFYEEVVTRGFLYRAFRGNWGVLMSTSVVIGFSTCFHWGSVSRAVFTFACLATLWVLLCFTRERTDSLWNCLLCHSAYNAVCTHLFVPCLFGMAVILVCHLTIGRSRSTPKSADRSVS